MMNFTDAAIHRSVDDVDERKLPAAVVWAKDPILGQRR